MKKKWKPGQKESDPIQKEWSPIQKEWSLRLLLTSMSVFVWGVYRPNRFLKPVRSFSIS
jgi:hypothetical protein